MRWPSRSLTGGPEIDTFTQMALGAAIGEAGFRRSCGGKAPAFGALCGLAPDLDIVVRIFGEWAPLIHHRGVSHSLPVLTLVAPLAAWLGWRWGRREGAYWRWVILAWLALVTHPLLDTFTSYGTQLFAPFSNRRYSWDGVSIIDLFYSVPLFVFVIMGWRRGRRASREGYSEPERERLFKPVRFGAIIALVWGTAYLGFGLMMNARARGLATKQLEREGFEPADVRAIPTWSQIGLWRIVARDERGNIRIGLVSAWAPRKIRFVAFNRPKNPRVARAFASDRGRTFHWFAQKMVAAEVDRDKKGWRVVLRDARFGPISNVKATPFRVEFRFTRKGRVKTVKRMPPKLGITVGGELSLLWRELWGKR